MRRFIIFLFLFVCLFSSVEAASIPPEITAQPGQVNPYKTRSELLMDATGYTGVFTPEQASEVWAKGLEQRSAAMQYTVMTNKLKMEYAEQLDRLGSNWVTGMSSPSVQGYTLTEINKTDDTHAEINLSIEVAATWSPSEFYNAKLWLTREGEFWRVDRILTDDGLYPYTLYQP
ncbi:exported hypothetical protein [uncultured Eubacteriales bacterium]|uniref:Uncharacterized protein n=1 Tax=uncultured Eubacteriales bacterium TaxID=172733 RepID=A0A212K3R9_9FIRM|nr:exported hypothetical protein [uncultured Eubacteriales bacterium]